jgi:hypothetical protein
MKAYYLSHNHYRVSEATAKRLAGRLPKDDEEIVMKLPNGNSAWLARTPHEGREVWAVYPVNNAPVGKKESDGSYTLDPVKNVAETDEDDYPLFV